MFGKHKKLYTHLKEEHDSLIEKSNSYISEIEALKLELQEMKKYVDPEFEVLNNLKKDMELISRKISDNELKFSNLSQQVQDKDKELLKLKTEIAEKQKEVASLDDDIHYASFGLFKPEFNFPTSIEYKLKLDNIREEQKRLIKDKKAVLAPDTLSIDGNLKKGKQYLNDSVKLLLRSFNNECDVLINKVKYNNVDTIKNRIKKSFEQLNKLNKHLEISINHLYLDRKIKELTLVHELAIKKQEEAEIAKEERERLREEAKLQKEIEQAKRTLQKEKQHYENALQTLNKQLENNEGNPDLLSKISEITTHLEEINKNILDVDYREANKRAGYVYIISNIGSFGENVFKIGMTRRLEPLDRINELGDASVPFNFDVHALIFADDAPALENALHKAFENKKLNMINARREFFNTTIKEIEEVVKNNFSKTVEFSYTPDAQQYRESLKLKKLT